MAPLKSASANLSGPGIKPSLPALVRVALAALALFGLYAGFKTVIELFGIDGDTSHSLVLWHGIRNHGISWVQDWRFTQDNWLLSLFPLHFLSFSLFGEKPSIPIVFGWLIYALSAFVSAAMARRMSYRRAPFFIFTILINFGLYAHVDGFVSHGTSHNITNLFGLTALLTCVAWAENPRTWHMLILFLLLTCGSVSDPWMLPTYTLPLFISSVILLPRPIGNLERKHLAALSAATGLSMLLAKTKLLGLFSFLPSFEFRFADAKTLANNAVYFVKDLGGLLNAIPMTQQDGFIPGLLSLAMFLFMLLWAAHSARSNRSNSFQRGPVLFFLVAAISSSGITAAFILSDTEAAHYSGRFLISIAYLLIISIGVLSDHIWIAAKHAFKCMTFTVFALFIVAGTTSLSSHALNMNFKPAQSHLEDMIAFLKQNGLSYGYGTFFGSNSNSLSVASNYDILVRPVLFSMTNGTIKMDRSQTSKRWYNLGDIPPGVHEFFVIALPDGRECPSAETCAKGLASQFGPPARVLTKDRATIFIWDHPLAGVEAPPIKALPHTTYQLNDSGPFLPGNGWYDSDSWGVWSCGKTSNIRFDVGNLNDVVLTIDTHCILPKENASQVLTIRANGHVIETIAYRSGSPSVRRTLTIPKDIVPVDGLLNMEFEVDHLLSPKDIGLSDDARKLGIGLRFIRFE